MRSSLASQAYIRALLAEISVARTKVAASCTVLPGLELSAEDLRKAAHKASMAVHDLNGAIDELYAAAGKLESEQQDRRRALPFSLINLNAGGCSL